MPPLLWLTVISLFILGACLGSFTSVLIYRLHSQKKGILRGRSACPECEADIRPSDLVPLASYLLLRGKCRSCSSEISYMYPLLELLGGLLLALLFLKFPFLDAGLRFSEAKLGLYALHSFYTVILLFTFFYDLRYMKVADEILLPGILVGLVATLFSPLTPSIIDAMFGAAIGIAFFGLQILASNGRWVGRGDLRVGAFMGVILGWKLTLAALFISYIIGSIVGLFIAFRIKKIQGVKIPLAPFLVIGTFLAMFFGEEILAWYLL